MSAYTMTQDQRDAVADLVAYNYASEERDAEEMGQEGDPRHIFTSIQLLQEWLEGNAPASTQVGSGIPEGQS